MGYHNPSCYLQGINAEGQEEEDDFELPALGRDGMKGLAPEAQDLAEGRLPALADPVDEGLSPGGWGRQESRQQTGRSPQKVLPGGVVVGFVGIEDTPWEQVQVPIFGRR